MRKETLGRRAAPWSGNIRYVFVFGAAENSSGARRAAPEWVAPFCLLMYRDVGERDGAGDEVDAVSQNAVEK